MGGGTQTNMGTKILTSMHEDNIIVERYILKNITLTSFTSHPLFGGLPRLDVFIALFPGNGRGGGAGASGGAGVRGGAGASGGTAEVRGGTGVRGGAGVNGWSKRVRLRGWAEVRGGAGVRGGAEVLLLLVSWLPPLGSGGCAPATSTMSGGLLLFMPTVILLFVVDGSRATAEHLKNEKMLCSNHKMSETS